MELSNLVNKDLSLNYNHLKIFNIYRKEPKNFHEEYLFNYVKESIDFEIALNELIDKGYLIFSNIHVIGVTKKYLIPPDKKII